MVPHYRRQEPQAGREARKKTVELRSERGVPGTANRQRGAVLFGVGLAAAALAVRNPRLAELVVVGAITLAALGQVTRKDLGDLLRNLVAWDNARLAELKEELRRRRETEGGQPTAS